jgi:peptide/nickel transport system substrate-binding protein
VFDHGDGQAERAQDKMSCTFIVTVLWTLLAFSPVSAETLRVGVPAKTSPMGNPYMSLVSSVTQIPSTIFDALTRINSNGQVIPELALSWEATSDTTWVFRLRPDVTFSNGEPFNADAAAQVIQWLIGPNGKTAMMASELKAVSGVRVIDDLTLEVVTRAPDAILPKRLSLIMMVPPKAWNDLGPQKFALSPIGTGSYTIENWGEDNGRSQLYANITSWRAPVHFDHLDMIYPLRDSIVRRQALESDEIDITVQVAFDDIQFLRAAGFQVIIQEVPQIRALALPNLGDEESPLRDIRVRQALNYAVDKEAIASAFYYGEVAPVGQGAVAGTAGYNPDIKPYPYDPDRARALLKEAGYADGFQLDAEVEIGQAQVIYEKAAQDLARVGVTLDVRAVVASLWLQKYFSSDWGDTEVLSVVWNAGAYRDTIRALEQYSCLKPNPYFCEPSMVPAIEATGSMFDPVARDRALQDIMADMHDLAPSIFLISHANTVVAKQEIKNIIITDRGLNYDKMTVE